MRRRRFLAAVAGVSAAALRPRRLRADEYGSPREVFEAIDRLEADVDLRLGRIAAALPTATAFAQAVVADHERHRGVRASLRRRLELPTASARLAAPEAGRGLDALRTAQEALVHAHAEGLPALGDREAVDTLARHMVDGSRHLTVIDLWIELEAARG